MESDLPPSRIDQPAQLVRKAAGFGHAISEIFAGMDLEITGLGKLVSKTLPSALSVDILPSVGPKIDELTTSAVQSCWSINSKVYLPLYTGLPHEITHISIEPTDPESRSPTLALAVTLENKSTDHVNRFMN